MANDLIQDLADKWWMLLPLARKKELAESIGLPLQFINSQHIQDFYLKK
jgi:hypothetical protein